MRACRFVDPEQIKKTLIENDVFISSDHVIAELNNIR